MTLKEPIEKIAVVGLGKLGSCVAACLAARGFQVIATDTDPAKVQALAQGRAPVEEPHLQETLTSGRSHLRATSDLRELVENSDAAFFIVPTPSLPDGNFDNQHLIRALRAVAEPAMTAKKSGYIFNVNSTVTPGTCDSIFLPLLRATLGEIPFGLGYNPEFIALGNVIQGLLQPDFVLIGESDPATGSALESLYAKLCLTPVPVKRMSCINAELAKISVNCAVTMKISFANQLSEVCSRIPGADAGAILQAIGSDRRIGPDYLKPGLGFGGPCFPRDNRLFQYVARSHGVEAPLAEATDRVNRRVNERLLQTVLAHAAAGPISILGLAYKPFSNVIEQAPGFWLCEQLLDLGKEVWTHDYMVSGAVLNGNGTERLRVCDDPSSLFGDEVKALVISCPWPEYRTVFEAAARGWRHSAVIIDPWRLIEDIAPRLKNASYLTSLG